MAEENRTENTEGQAQDKNEPFFQLVRCYMKDASLEMPHAPEIFMTTPEEQPNVDIQFECLSVRFRSPTRMRWWCAARSRYP